MRPPPGPRRWTKARHGRFRPHRPRRDAPRHRGIRGLPPLRVEEIDTPVLFLTARDATDDKLTGLVHGDDYVTKPFSIDELVARIRAVLRRSGRGTNR